MEKETLHSAIPRDFVRHLEGLIEATRLDLCADDQTERGCYSIYMSLAPIYFIALESEISKLDSPEGLTPKLLEHLQNKNLLRQKPKDYAHLVSSFKRLFLETSRYLNSAMPREVK